MAHQINFNEKTGKHSFFSVKEKPWHGLGQIVTNYPTSCEALSYAGLDYQVEKRRLFTMDGAHHSDNAGTLRPAVEVPHYYATVRTDNDAVLGVVGKDYNVVQNTDAFAFFDALVADGNIRYETAGALGKGERIFITAKLPTCICVGREDLIEQYLFLTTSHDGLGSITVAFTPIRIVCNNTLHVAFRNCSSAFKIRHTSNARERLEQAHKIMGITGQLSDRLTGTLNHWVKVKVTDEQVKALIHQALAPNKDALSTLDSEHKEHYSTHFRNICDSVYAYAMGSPAQQTETTAGTLFGAYNAITGYYQNVCSYRDGESKLKSLLYGGTAQVRTGKAFQLCGEFARIGVAALALN